MLLCYKSRPRPQTARWSALIAGIWWGGKRFAANKATEDEVSRLGRVVVERVWTEMMRK